MVLLRNPERATVYPRRVEAALRRGAFALMLAHNQPTGVVSIAPARWGRTASGSSRRPSMTIASSPSGHVPAGQLFAMKVIIGNVSKGRPGRPTHPADEPGVRTPTTVRRPGAGQAARSCPAVAGAP